MRLWRCVADWQLRCCVGRTGFCIRNHTRRIESKTTPKGVALDSLAERVGFEPTVRQAVHLISSQARSTTPAPLQFRSHPTLRVGLTRAVPGARPAGAPRASQFTPGELVEPTVRQAVHLISSQARSTTPAPLQFRSHPTLRVGLTRAVPGARPAGAPRASQFTPGELVEPTVRQAVHLISSQARSTTPAPLRWSALYLFSAARVGWTCAFGAASPTRSFAAASVEQGSLLDRTRQATQKRPRKAGLS